MDFGLFQMICLLSEDLSLYLFHVCFLLVSRFEILWLTLCQLHNEFVIEVGIKVSLCYVIITVISDALFSPK